MNVKDIINILNDNGLSEVEELVAADKYSLINFYFDFDKDVEAAAKAYADDESTAGSEEWMNEFYLPYLYDYANDEVLEIVEEIIEDLDVEGEMMAFQMNEKTAGYVQFMVLFNEEGCDVAIEKVVKEYMNKK